MDRQQTQLQLQANTWLEKQKVGLTASQKQAFIQWLNTSKAHQTAYQESVQVERLLMQFSEHEIEQLNTPKPKRFLSTWAIAACAACLMLTITGYQLWPNEVSPTQYTAHYKSNRGEQFDIALPDGSQLSVDAKTQISLDFNPNSRKNKLVQGRVFFNVASDLQRPFIVSTDDTKITVLGTRFSVDKKKHSTRISVEHGRVKIQNNHHLIELVQGQHVVFNELGMDVQTIDPTLVDAWRSGRLVFSNAPLVEVCAEFNRYHDTEFTFSDDQVAALKVSGTFSAVQLDNFLNLLPHVLPVEIKSENNQVIISKADNS